MGDFRLLYPNDYVGAHHLGTKDATRTIKSIGLEALRTNGGKTERKPVIVFADSDKKFVVCKTNARAIAELYGNDTDAWKGKKITLYATTTKFGPATVDCIRIRPKKGTGEVPPEPPVDENPFPIEGREPGEEG